MKTITEFANKCLHEMNTGELTTTECVAKYLDLWHTEKNKLITDSQPSILGAVSSTLKSKDEAVDVGFKKANGSNYNCRKVIRDLDSDIYYSGWMDCYDWMSGNDR